MDSPPQRDVTYQPLLERIQLGDDHALETLYHELYDALWRFAFRFVKSRDMADDLVQDTFVLLWEQRHAIDVKQNLRNYLFGIVRHRAIDWTRREERLKARIDAVGNAIGIGKGQRAIAADEDVRMAMLQDALAKAISELPEARRTPLVLRWEHSMSYDDIAAITGMSIANVRQQVARARETLRVKLSNHFE